MVSNIFLAILIEVVPCLLSFMESLFRKLPLIASATQVSVVEQFSYTSVGSSLRHRPVYLISRSSRYKPQKLIVRVHIV